MSSRSELWDLANELRRSQSLDLTALVNAAKQHGIPIDIRAVRDFAWALGGLAPLTPDESLVDTLKYLARSRSPRSVLDPWASIGHIVLPVADAVKLQDAVAITMHASDAEVGKIIDADGRLRWLIGDPLSKLDEVGEFELIVSCPPWGYKGRNDSLLLNGVLVRADYGNLLVAKSCAAHLTQDGIGAFVLPRSAIFRQNPESLRAVLDPLGLNLSALVHVPNGFFAGTSIDSYLVIIERHAHADLFIAEISHSHQHNEEIVNNLLARRSSDDLSTGYITRLVDFSSYQEIDAKQRAEQLALRMGAKPVPMSDISSEINLTRSKDPQTFLDKDNAIYLPLIGTSPARTSRNELSLKAHNYAQIVLDPEKALAPYVAGYFNSALGRITLEGLKSGATIQHVTKKALQHCTVYLVDINTQLQCIQADSKASNLMSELSTLRSSVWDDPRAIRKLTMQLEKVNNEDTLLSWMDRLPFPLASILWTYNSVGHDDDKQRYEHLLHFFEALVEFYAIIMWSAMYNTPALRNDGRFPLRKDKPFRTSFEQSTFGT